MTHTGSSGVSLVDGVIEGVHRAAGESAPWARQGVQTGHERVAPIVSPCLALRALECRVLPPVEAGVVDIPLPPRLRGNNWIETRGVPSGRSLSILGVHSWSAPMFLLGVISSSLAMPSRSLSPDAYALPG